MHKELERQIIENNDDFEASIRLHHECNVYDELSIQELQQLLKDK